MEGSNSTRIHDVLGSVQFTIDPIKMPMSRFLTWHASGYKFETLATLPAPWGETSREYIEDRENEVVSNKAQYCSVVRTGLGKTILCLGGEVDAGEQLRKDPGLILFCFRPFFFSPGKADTRNTPVWDSKPSKQGDPINWVELKTSVEIRNDRDRDNFERKLMKYWIQSFLLGVPKVVVGFRSRDGVLTKVEEIDVASMPATVARRGRQWDGNVCINFAAECLECGFFFVFFFPFPGFFPFLFFHFIFLSPSANLFSPQYGD